MAGWFRGKSDVIWGRSMGLHNHQQVVITRSSRGVVSAELSLHPKVCIVHAKLQKLSA